MNKTKEQWEADVLKQIKLCGGFSYWWAEDNMFVWCAMQRLINKKIITELPALYPFWSFVFNKPLDTLG